MMIPVSSRGVYYDLSISPYEFNSYGLILKFSSAKKLEIYRRELDQRKEKINRKFAQINEISLLNLGITPMMDKKIQMRIYDEVEV
jgi:hypothetical protein